MTQKEVLLLTRYFESQDSSWPNTIEQFCIINLNKAKNWARAQKTETIDDLLANTEPQ